MAMMRRITEIIVVVTVQINGVRYDLLWEGRSQAGLRLTNFV